MKKKRKNPALDYTIVIVGCAILLVVALLAILGIGQVIKSGISAGKNQNPHQVSGTDGIGDTEDLTEEENNTGTEELTEEVTEAETETETESQENAPFVAEQIPNIESLDAEGQGWGQGVQFDEWNRPISAVKYQDTYGQYNAYFIGENTQDIYLTFDEGYEYGCTPGILDTLKEKGVKAVFFITKSYAKNNPELVQRMIDEGHTLGNHSVTHPADGLPSQTIEQQQNEVVECHQYILDNFGYTMHLFRYPTGKFSVQSLALVNNCNYKSVFWSFAYLDYDVNNQPDQAKSLQKLVDRIHPGAIYLLHAESETNTAILGSFIDQVRAAGYDLKVFS